MKRAIIATALALFVFVIGTAALVAAAAAALIRWPEIAINKTTVEILARHLSPLGVDLKVKDVKVYSESHALLDKSIRIEFKNLSVAYKPSLERATFTLADISVRASLEKFVPRLKAIGPILIEGGDVAYRTFDDGSETDTGPIALIPKVALPGFLSGVKFFPANISITRFEFGDAKDPISGNLLLNVIADENNEIASIKLSGEMSLPSDGGNISLLAEAKSESKFREGDWKLSSSANASLPSATKLSAEAEISSPDENSLDSALSLAFSQGKVRADARLKGTAGREALKVSIDAEATGITDAVTALSVKGCNAALRRTDEKNNRGALSLDCPVSVRLKKIALPGEMDSFYRIPESLAVGIKGEASTFFLPDPDAHADGKVTVELRPIKDQLIDTQGIVNATFSGVLSEPVDRWKIDSKADFHLSIAKFSLLADTLSKTAWPVPAPFSVLDGSIDFFVQGNMSSESGKARFPAKLALNLKSEKQVIEADSKGELTFVLVGQSVRNPALDLAVVLSDVQLELPNLALASIPRLTMDGRIEAEPKAKKNDDDPDIGLDWQLSVVTPPGKPVRILSNVTPTHIPILLDLLVDEMKTTGKVTLADFPVELFRRRAEIDSLVLDLKHPAENSEIHGSITIPYPDYKVSILVAGTMDDPTITMQSTPPLSQADIISTLLYGEPLDALDDDGASSVSSMSAAIADRSLALVSMFVLASTPIQSVRYNPQTKAFSARIRLGKKTSLFGGGGGGSQEVGMRQRLGKGWSIKTSYGTTNDPSAISGATALIEWTKRY